MKFLLLEGIHSHAEQSFQKAGFLVQRVSSSVQWEKSAEGVQGLCVRSRTQLTGDILKTLSPALRVVGAFCIGTDQVDLTAACRMGIPVFNAPYGNTRSVAELTIGHIISLSRKTHWFNRLMHQKKWQKTAQNSCEVRGKTLGIVGYGHIGTQTGILAEALGMKVLYFDIIEKLPIGNARPSASLKELLSLSDIVTLHVPDTPLTKNMIQHTELKCMKANSSLINTSRGAVLNINDLKTALQEGRLKGAAIDVFPQEPLASSSNNWTTPLQGFENVILTPHIAGSTEEAQANIARQVSAALIKYVLYGVSEGAVNFPILNPPPLEPDGPYRRLVNVHRNVPGVLADINKRAEQLKINITTQQLATNAHIGYLVMDAEKQQIQKLSQAISPLSTSIRTWLLP